MEVNACTYPSLLILLSVIVGMIWAGGGHFNCLFPVDTFEVWFDKPDYMIRGVGSTSSYISQSVDLFVCGLWWDSCGEHF